MSTMWPEDTDMEYDDSEGAEGYYDSEDLDGESRSAADRQRRARQRRVELASRRQAQVQARARSAARPAVPPSGGPGTAAPSARSAARQAATAVRNLDLETKVQEDAFRSAISAQSKRMSRAEYAAVAGAAVNQFIESFEAPDNPHFRAALRFAPLLLLSPQRKGTGFEAFIKDPRVIGAAAVAGVTIVGENRKRSTYAREISVLSAGELVVDEEDQFIADVLDGRGVVLDKLVAWKSSAPEIAAIDEATGRVTGRKAGVVVITATADGIVRRVRLKVTAKAAGGAGK